MRITTRELLTLVAFVALAIGSLRIGGALATVTVGTVISFSMAMGIVALVSRNHRQAFAIGFIVPVLAYATIHLASGRDELNPHDNFALATTQAFRPVYEAFVSSTWVEAGTGKELPDYDPTANPVRHAGGGMLPPGMPSVTTIETPKRTTFMVVAHSLLASLIGYAGAKFAVYVRASDA